MKKLIIWFLTKVSKMFDKNKIPRLDSYSIKKSRKDFKDKYDNNSKAFNDKNTKL